MNLFGEGNFALTAAKEIDATQDYLDMSKDVTNCQNEVSLEVCETKKYFEKVMEKCNCLPVNIGSSYKVQDIVINIDYKVLFCYIISGTPL